MKKNKILKEKVCNDNYNEMDENQQRINTINKKVDTINKIAKDYNIYPSPKIDQIPLYFNDIVIAQDKWNKNKQLIVKTYYYGRNINDINRLIQDYPNHHFYEMIRNQVVKVFLDIDEVEFTTEELENELLNFISIINKVYSIEITRTDLIVQVKECDDGLFRSIHIILPNYKMDFEEQLWFFTNYYPTADLRVYRNNGLLCLLGNTKMKIGLDKETGDILKMSSPFTLFGTTDFIDTDMYISNCDECDLLSSSEYEMYRLSNINIITKTATECVKESKDKLPLKNASTTLLTNQYNLLQTILKFIPADDNFWISELWSKLVCCCKYNNINGIDDFLRKSPQKTIIKKYTYDRNKKWFDDEITDIKHTNIINMVCKVNEVLFKINGKQIYYEKYGMGIMDTPHLREYIHKKTGLSKKIIEDRFILTNQENITDNKNPATKKRTKPTHIVFNTEWKLDLVYYQLFQNNKPAFNYYQDWYKEKQTEIKLDGWTEMSKEEIAKRALEFMNNTAKMFGVKMVWGEGKSYLIMKPVVDWCMDNNKRVLILTENNALNMDVYCDLVAKHGKHIVKSHKSGKITDEDKIVICSEESSIKLVDMDFDVIILDEYETLVSHLNSETFGKYHTSYDEINLLARQLIRAEKILILDADLSNERIQPIKTAIKLQDTDIELYYSRVNKWSNHTFNIYQNDYEAFLTKIDADLNDDKRIAIAHMSRTNADVLLQYLMRRHPTKKILYIAGDKKNKSDGKKYYKKYPVEDEDGNIMRDENGEVIMKYQLKCLNKMEMKKDMNHKINDENVDIWLYTPSVITGISYNTPDYFSKTYFIGSDNSCCARLGIQMLFRVRELIDTTINIHIPQLGEILNEPTDEDIYNYLFKNIMFSLEEKDLHKYIFPKPDFNNIEINKLYTDINIINIKEIYMSNLSCGHEMIKRLTINHGLKVNYIPKFIEKIDYELMEKEITIANKMNRDYEADVYANTRYIEMREINRKRKKNIIENDNQQSIREVNKSDLLNDLGLRQDYLVEREAVPMDSMKKITYDKRRTEYYDGYKNTDIKLFNSDGNDKLITDNKISNGKSLWVDKNWRDGRDWEKNKEYKHNGKITDINSKLRLRNIDLMDRNIGGFEYQYNDTGDEIIKTSLTYDRIIHRNPEIFKFLLKTKHTDSIELINKFNTHTIKIENDNMEWNNIEEYKNFHKIAVVVLKSFFPKMINDKNNNIIFKKYMFSSKYFNEKLEDNQDFIKNNMMDLLRLKSFVATNLTKYDKENPEHQRMLYTFISGIITKLGFDVKAPTNKHRENEFYKITPKKHIHIEYNPVFKRVVEDKTIIVVKRFNNIDNENYPYSQTDKLHINNNTYPKQENEQLFIDGILVYEDKTKRDGTSNIYTEMKRETKIIPKVLKNIASIIKEIPKLSTIKLESKVVLYKTTNKNTSVLKNYKYKDIHYKKKPAIRDIIDYSNCLNNKYEYGNATERDIKKIKRLNKKSICKSHEFYNKYRVILCGRFDKELNKAYWKDRDDYRGFKEKENFTKIKEKVCLINDDEY